MSTTTVTLTESWQLVLAGPGIVQAAQELEGADPTVYPELATEPEFEKMFVHEGTSSPADDFDYVECSRVVEYGGANNIYMRTHRGERIVKVVQF